jgi:hypothetical protein
MRGLLEIEQPAIPSWNLHSFKAELCGPTADRRQIVEGRSIGAELGEMNAWSLKRFHFEPDLRRTTTFALTLTDELLDIAPSFGETGSSVKCLPFKQVDLGSNSSLAS